MGKAKKMELFAEKGHDAVIYESYHFWREALNEKLKLKATKQLDKQIMDKSGKNRSGAGSFDSAKCVQWAVLY